MPLRFSEHLWSRYCDTMIRIKLLLLMSTMLIPLAFSLETDPAGLDLSDLTTGTDSYTGLSDRKVWTGRIVVRKGVRLFPEEVEEPNGSDVQTELTDHYEGYQSDSPDSAELRFGSKALDSIKTTQEPDIYLYPAYKAAEEKLRRLNPTVHCGGDSMALRVQGNRVPNIMVDRGEEGVVPVTNLPANCGISMKRVRRDVLVVAQYQGCHITQEGDDYVLPLRLWGAPLDLCCPVASSTNVTPDPSAVLASDPRPFPYYTGDQFYHHGHFWHSPANAPSTSAPTTAPTPAPTTTSTLPASDPLPDWYPFGPFPYRYRYPQGHFWKAPTPPPTTAATTPPPTTAAPAPASDPLQNWYPIGPFPYRWRHQFYPYANFWQGPTTAPSTQAPTTTTPTTTTSAVPANDPQYNWQPIGPYNRWRPFYPHGHFWQYPTAAPSTTTPAPTTTSAVPTVPANDPQNIWYPIDPPYQWRPFYPNFWQYPTSAPSTVAPTTTTSAPTVPASDSQQNWYNPNGFYPYGYPWMKPAQRPWFTSDHFTKG